MAINLDADKAEALKRNNSFAWGIVAVFLFLILVTTCIRTIVITHQFNEANYDPYPTSAREDLGQLERAATTLRR